MSAFNMPALGADMTSGVLLEWYVEPGATVHRGDIVAVVDTDKAEIEIESFEDGVIDDLCAPDTRVDVGGRLATITTEADRTRIAAAPPTVEASHADHHLDGRPRVSPLARRAAAAQHVDLSSLHGSGTGDAITLADVERAAGGTPPAADLAVPGTPTRTESPAADDAPPVERMPERPRDAVPGSALPTTAALMARSKREIPHFYVERTIDLSAATRWLDHRNGGRPAAERLLPAALLIAVTARAVRETPALNGFVRDGVVEQATAVNVGVAIGMRGGGVLAPALLDADQASVDETMRALTDLAGRAKRGRLRARETTDATITVTNLGDRGADKVFGVIYPPQIAIVGFGAIRECVVAVDGMVAVRPTVVATVSADHRATDGLMASRLLARIDDHLQRLERL